MDKVENYIICKQNGMELKMLCKSRPVSFHDQNFQLDPDSASSLLRSSKFSPGECQQASQHRGSKDQKPRDWHEAMRTPERDGQQEAARGRHDMDDRGRQETGKETEI